LLRHDERIAERNRSLFEKASEYIAPVLDAIERDQFQNFPARLAMKGQTDQRLTDFYNGAGRQIVKLVVIEEDIFAQIPGFWTAVDQDWPRRDQNLAKRRAGDTAADAVLIKCKCRDFFECRAVFALDGQIGDGPCLLTS
jgi:hypothetical protein